jgi:hypothetical protein
MSAPQQTVYFYTPTTVGNLTTAVQTLNQNNNWSRGNPVSIELINTISANSATGSIWGWRGPTQAVKVYKMLYYSTPALESSVERFSATVYVPSTISTGAVLSAIFGLQPTDNETNVGWAFFGNDAPYNLWNQAAAYDLIVPGLAALARGTPQGLTPAGYPTTVKGICSQNVYMPFMCCAAAGMVTVVADGVGFGQSVNIQTFNYLQNVYPAVDALRALRTLIVSQPTIFNSYSFPSVLPVVYAGYSRAGIFGPAIANEFQSGVSPTLPPTEAALFRFDRIITGGIPNLYARVKEQCQTNLYAPQDITFATLLGYNPTDTITSSLWSAHALQTIAPTVITSDFFQFTSFQTAVKNALFYDTANYPPTSTGYGLWSQYTPSDGVRIDLKQIFNAQALANPSYFAEYYTPNHGWTNNFRPLTKLTNIPVMEVNCLQDALVCNLDTGFDSATTLDVYMSTGPNYGLVSYSGAGKSISATGINVSTGSFASYISMQNDVASSSRGMANNEFKRFQINELYWDTTSYTDAQNGGSHGGFADLAFTNIVRSILTGQTIPST